MQRNYVSVIVKFKLMMLEYLSNSLIIMSALQNYQQHDSVYATTWLHITCVCAFICNYFSSFKVPSNGFCQQFTTLHTHKLAYTYIYIIVKNIWGSLKSAAKGKIGRAVRTMATMKLSHTTNYWHESEEYE